VRRVGGSGTLERDRRIRDGIELGDPARRLYVRVRLIRDDVDGGEVAENRLRIDAGSVRCRIVAQISDDAGNARPIIIGRDQRAVGPVLREGQRLRRVVRR
jgi:hypothetical protein